MCYSLKAVQAGPNHSSGLIRFRSVERILAAVLAVESPATEQPRPVRSTTRPMTTHLRSQPIGQPSAVRCCIHQSR